MACWRIQHIDLGTENIPQHRTCTAGYFGITPIDSKSVSRDQGNGLEMQLVQHGGERREAPHGGRHIVARTPRKRVVTVNGRIAWANQRLPERHPLQGKDHATRTFARWYVNPGPTPPGIRRRTLCNACTEPRPFSSLAAAPPVQAAFLTHYRKPAARAVELRPFPSLHLA